jgi:thioredoxin 1
MPASIALRAVIAIVVAGACLGVWKLLGLAVLRRAGRTGSGGPESLRGFVSGKPGFLIFGSPHCAPCVHAQKPAAKKLLGELGEAIQLIEVDVTEEPSLAERYGVVSLPTVFLLDGSGKPRHVNHGFVSADEMRRQIAPYLA